MKESLLRKMVDTSIDWQLEVGTPWVGEIIDKDSFLEDVFLEAGYAINDQNALGLCLREVEIKKINTTVCNILIRENKTRLLSTAIILAGLLQLREANEYLIRLVDENRCIYADAINILKILFMGIDNKDTDALDWLIEFAEVIATGDSNSNKAALFKIKLLMLKGDRDSYTIVSNIIKTFNKRNDRRTVIRYLPDLQLNGFDTSTWKDFILEEEGSVSFDDGYAAEWIYAINDEKITKEFFILRDPSTIYPILNKALRNPKKWIFLKPIITELVDSLASNERYAHSIVVQMIALLGMWNEDVSSYISHTNWVKSCGGMLGQIHREPLIGSQDIPCERHDTEIKMVIKFCRLVHKEEPPSEVEEHDFMIDFFDSISDIREIICSIYIGLGIDDRLKFITGINELNHQTNSRLMQNWGEAFDWDWWVRKNYSLDNVSDLGIFHYDFWYQTDFYYSTIREFNTLLLCLLNNTGEPLIQLEEEFIANAGFVYDEILLIFQHYRSKVSQSPIAQLKVKLLTTKIDSNYELKDNEFEILYPHLFKHTRLGRDRNSYIEILINHGRNYLQKHSEIAMQIFILFDLDSKLKEIVGAYIHPVSHNSDQSKSININADFHYGNYVSKLLAVVAPIENNELSKNEIIKRSIEFFKSNQMLEFSIVLLERMISFLSTNEFADYFELLLSQKVLNIEEITQVVRYLVVFPSEKLCSVYEKFLLIEGNDDQYIPIYGRPRKTTEE